MAEQFEQLVKKLNLESDSELEILISHVRDSLKHLSGSETMGRSSSTSKEGAPLETLVQSSTSSHFSGAKAITQDVQELIFNHLSPEERAIASRASKSWRAMLMLKSHWWGTARDPIVVKKIMTLAQGDRFGHFTRRLSRLHCRLYVMNPRQPNEVSLNWFSNQHEEHLHFSSRGVTTTMLPENVTPSHNSKSKAQFENIEIFSHLCVSTGILPSSSNWSAIVARMMFNKNVQDQSGGINKNDWAAGNVTGWKFSGPMTSLHLFTILGRFGPRAAIINLQEVNPFKSSNGEPPTLIQKFELSALQFLILPPRLSASVFSEFLTPRLTIVEGSVSSLLSLGSALLSVSFIWVTLDLSPEHHDSEVLKLLGILTTASQVSLLILRERELKDSASKIRIDLNCLLNLLLQTKIDTERVGFCWCPNLDVISGTESLEVRRNLAQELESLRSEVYQKGLRKTGLRLNNFTLSQD